MWILFPRACFFRLLAICMTEGGILDSWILDTEGDE
jgi:hypothetical protein